MNKFKNIALTAVAALAVGTSVKAEAWNGRRTAGAVAVAAGLLGLAANKVVAQRARKRGKLTRAQQYAHTGVNTVCGIAAGGGVVVIAGDVVKDQRAQASSKALVKVKGALAKPQAEQAAALEAAGYKGLTVLNVGETKNPEYIKLLVKHCGVTAPKEKGAAVTVTAEHLKALKAAVARAEGINGENGLEKAYEDAKAARAFFCDASEKALKEPEAKDGKSVTAEQTEAYEKLVAAYKDLTASAPEAPKALEANANEDAKKTHAAEVTKHKAALAKHKEAVAKARKVNAALTKLVDAEAKAKAALDQAQARVDDAFVRLAIQNARTWFGKFVDAGTFAKTVRFKEAPKAATAKAA